MADPDPQAGNAAEKPTRSELHGLDAGELFARGLHTVKPSVGASAWEPPEPEALGRLLPGYQIESLLGRGGMGAVYKGVQLNLERPVAIKLLPAEIAADAEFVSRFKREARTLARLQHSRIVTIHDFGQTTEGHLYFVMEYINGTDLRRILKGPGLDPEQALAVVGQLCDALQAAHREGIVHRDIKPENVLVTKDGYVKLADFGLSRPPQEDGGPKLTETNMVMGTANYMAPEQQDGAVKADHRSDIFALGVMFYEMLTGQTPRGVFDPPSSKVQVDVRIDEVVLKALQSEPGRRYQQASEMKTDVERIRSTPPAQPPAASSPAAASPQVSRPASTRRRERDHVPLVAAVVIALFLGATGYWLWQKDVRSNSGPRADAAANHAIPPGEAAPTTATKDAPFVNSLGMKFVPVPILGGPTGGQQVLFSVWDTRVQDYEAFVKETGREWQAVNLPQGPIHPAVNMTWDDAEAFCAWLTERERRAGKLGPNERYRLPSDHEWSCAVGIGDREDAAKAPSEKDSKIKDVFPWGAQWPPPKGAGNYFGEEQGSGNANVLVDYNDGFVATSPVGSFPANPLGLFDMGGNVWQWVEDWLDAGRKTHTKRGACWHDSNRSLLLSSYRSPDASGFHSRDRGFRCVLAPDAVALFNGRDLTGWKSVGRGWTVKDGAITCDPTAHPSFLVWKNGTVFDFELTCRYRSNREYEEYKDWYSGVLFRDRITNPTLFNVVGPMVEASWYFETTGTLSDFARSGLLANRGEKGFVVNGDVMRPAAVYVTDSIGDQGQMQASFKEDDWNDLKIIAVRNHIQLFVNGYLATDVVDESNGNITSGGLALWRGPFQFKDLFLKEIKGGASAVVPSSSIPAVLPAKVAGVKAVYVGEGSMPAKKVGTKDYKDVVSETDDPSAPFRGQGVYFDSHLQHEIHYDIDSPTPLTELSYTGAAFNNFTITITDQQSKSLLRSASYNGGNTRRQIRMPLPNLTHFRMTVHNDATVWHLVEDVHFGASNSSVPAASH